MKGEIKNPVKNLKSIKTTKIIERRNKSIERNHFYSNAENQLKDLYSDYIHDICISDYNE